MGHLLLTKNRLDLNPRGTTSKINEMTKQALYNQLPEKLTRTSPFILTEFYLPENQQLLEKNMLKLDFFVVLENLIEPYSLYYALQRNPKDTIIIEADIFQMNKNYMDILEGAIRMTPESGIPWKVTYRHNPPFLFSGKIILCTALRESDIRKTKAFKSICPNAHFI